MSIFLLQTMLFSEKNEYEIKAHFIGTFTRFIEWPVLLDLESCPQTFMIGIVGDSPFNGFIEDIYSNAELKGLPVIIKHIKKLDEISRCDMLFICKSEKNNIFKLLSITEKLPILTLADTPGFAEKGVLINLFVEKNKTKFEINYPAIKSTGLIFNYKLLSLARIIDKEEKK